MHLHRNKLIAALLLMLAALTVCSCRSQAETDPSPSIGPSGSGSTVSTESLGIGLGKAADGEMSATGILGRTPVFVPATNPEDARLFAWALFSSRGTTETGPELLALIGPSLAPTSTHPMHERLLALEGRLVTVTGSGAEQNFTRVSSIEEAGPLTEPQSAALGSVLEPGTWWLSWAPVYSLYWEAAGPRYQSLDEALPDLTFTPARPADSPAGDLLGVQGDDFSGPEYRGVTLFFKEGFTVGITPAGSPANDPRELEAQARDLKAGTEPPYPTRVDVAGHLGILQGLDSSPNQLAWQDDESAYVLTYVGNAYDPAAPSGDTLLAIAESFYR